MLIRFFYSVVMKSVNLFFNNNWRNSDLICIYKDSYLKILTLPDETRLADPHTLLLKGWTIWQDSLRLSDSHTVYSKDKLAVSI